EVRPVWNNEMRINHQNFSNSRRNFAPTAVLTKSGIVPISTVRQSSSRAAAPQVLLGNKGLMLLSPQHAGFGDLKLKYNIMSPKTVDHTFGASKDALKDQGYFGNGCSRHITGTISYLADFKEHDEGMFPLGKELKVVRLLAKAQLELMCEKKNSVLFTDTECFVLSPNFKLADESQVLFKVPRKNNMYSFDIKNIVPQKDLTCLLAKATNDESTLWHRRLDQLGKFDGKLDKGIFVGYSTISKAFRVYNIRTRKVEENLHITFLVKEQVLIQVNLAWRQNQVKTIS
nr:ribonuclease H-like domain-containing protein [Tanacetum cinerariifolium]